MSPIYTSNCVCCCDCYPSSLYVSVSAYNDGYGISWSSFNQTIYKCCIVNQQVGSQYSGIIGSRPCVIYKLNPVLSNSNNGSYLNMAITTSNYGWPYKCFRTQIWIMPGVYSFLNNSSTACVIPRDNYTAQTACYGLGVDEFCGPTKTYDLEGYPDTYFKSSGNLAGCNCTSTTPPYGQHRVTNYGPLYFSTNIISARCTIATGSFALDYISPNITVTIS